MTNSKERASGPNTMESMHTPIMLKQSSIRQDVHSDTLHDQHPQGDYGDKGSGGHGATRTCTRRHMQGATVQGAPHGEFADTYEQQIYS